MSPTSPKSPNLGKMRQKIVEMKKMMMMPLEMRQKILRMRVTTSVTLLQIQMKLNLILKTKKAKIQVQRSMKIIQTKWYKRSRKNSWRYLLSSVYQ
jgi:hypothetical protein